MPFESGLCQKSSMVWAIGRRGLQRRPDKQAPIGLGKRWMITLYHCADARSFRPLWALEELGLAYELKMLPFPPRVHDRGYLQVNPLGTIPAFFDGEMRMTESAAICEYLAAKFGAGTLGVSVDEPEMMIAAQPPKNVAVAKVYALMEKSI